MLCEECKVNEARYLISVVMDDEVRQRHLCSDCMMKMNMDIAGGNIRGLLNSILTAITGTSKEEDVPEEEDVTCQRCQTTWGQFRKSGRLGCPGCYEAFREKLQPTLLQIHGRMQHAGRQPLCNEDAQRARSQHEELTRQMEQAVALEDFETAAVLRDRIRALARKGEEA